MRSANIEEFVKERMAKHDKNVFKTSVWGQKTAFFCGRDGHRFLFSGEGSLIVSWWPPIMQRIFPTSLINTVGDDARLTRRLLSVVIQKPESLRRYVAMVDAFTRSNVAREWGGRDEVTVYPLIKDYTFALTCALFAGIRDGEQTSRLGERFYVLLKGMGQLPVNLPGTRYYKAVKAGDAIKEELRRVVRERREEVEVGGDDGEVKEDLLSYLVVTGDETGRRMTEEEIVDNVLLLLHAGHDTTSCTLTLVLKHLADEPEIYDKVLEGESPGERFGLGRHTKMKYSWNVVSEVLRHWAPVQGTFRKAITDFTFDGFTIPKGYKLYWTAFSTHLDETYFPEPRKFDPSRFEGDKGPVPHTYVPFGGGPRMCPGKELARLVILVFLHNVIMKYRWESVFPNERVVTDPLPTPSEGLPIHIHPHSF
ncbi:hypothetical protein QJS10_CPB19g01664 [Acorus calamus]|uniref:Cytochrome P450 n=1 Tax=Acorus calamus TaxID=4465 RepID=A0AAV9CEL7_ACOCL|nr:hypothetical protein QJS10_CPB19g01664 [Acorus calamus]